MAEEPHGRQFVRLKSGPVGCCRGVSTRYFGIASGGHGRKAALTSSGCESFTNTPIERTCLLRKIYYDYSVRTRELVLRLIGDRSPASSSEVAEELGVTRQTAHHHLSALVRSGDLIRRGEGRATRYFPSPLASLPELAAWLDQEADAQEFFGSVGDSLRQRYQADDPLAPVVWAFDYMLLEASDERSDDHGPFGPLWEMRGGPHPPPLDGVPDEAVALWERLAELVEHPFLKARLNDLMRERRWADSPYLKAKAAIDAYLELVPPVARGMDCVNALARAGGLARQVNDGQRQQIVVRAALHHAGADLLDDEPKPGIVLRLLDTAMKDSGEEVHIEVAVLLEQATEVFDDPWIRDEIIERQLAIASGGREQQRSLQRASVDIWLKHAADSSGLRRRLLLERALEHARTYGFRELAEQIRQEVQEVEFREDEIQSTSGKVELPSAYIENTIAQIIAGDSWSICLGRLLILGPLSGNLQRNIDSVHQQTQQFMFHRLARTEVLGPWNETIFVADTEEEKARLELSRHESLAIDMASYIVAEALDDIRTTHGHPTKMEIQDLFSTPIIDSDTAERMAASVEHFLQGRFDECVMVIIPRIERTIRALLRKLGAPTWSEPRSGAFGRQRSLWQLLDQLQSHLDENWRRYLITLLVNPLGSNLRNIHMHGLAPKGTRGQAAALIHASVFLASLELRSQAEGPIESAGPDHKTS